MEIEKTGKIIRKTAKKKNCKQIEWEPELHKAVREADEVEHIGADVRSPVKRRMGRAWLNKRGIIYHYHTVQEISDATLQSIKNLADRPGTEGEGKAARATYERLKGKVKKDPNKLDKWSDNRSKWADKLKDIKAKRDVKEDEEIDELSKEKLLNYIDKSGKECRAKTASPKRVKGNEKAFDKYMTKRFHEEETLITENWDKMSHEAKELVLHADNDAHLYHSSHEPIMSNLKKKAKKGVYDPAKAKTLWGYHADRAAVSYHKDHGSPGQPWHKMFTPGHRKEAASHWEELHRDELHEGVETSPLMEDKNKQKSSDPYAWMDTPAFKGLKGLPKGHKFKQQEKKIMDKKVKETFDLPQDLIDAAAKIGEDQSQFSDAAAQDAKSQGQATPKKGKKNLATATGGTPTAPPNMG